MIRKVDPCHTMRDRQGKSWEVKDRTILISTMSQCKGFLRRDVGTMVGSYWSSVTFNFSVPGQSLGRALPISLPNLRLDLF